MNKFLPFLFLFGFNLYITCQVTKISYLEISKNNKTGSDSLNYTKFFIKEVENPSIRFDSLSKDIIKSNFEVDEMVVYKNCEVYYSRQARQTCMDNTVFKSIFQYLEYPSQNSNHENFGSVIFSFIVDKNGDFIPYSLSYNSDSLKNSVLSALNKWYSTANDYKSKPALLQKNPVNYSSYVIFSFLSEYNSSAISSLPEIKNLNTEIILNTELKKEEIIDVKTKNNVNLVEDE